MSETEISKFLSYILRHKPESIGLSLNTEGWLDIDALIEAANQHGTPLTKNEVLKVVANSDKNRFSISDDSSYIRASQGHSNANVAINFESKIPPIVLYHGTALRFLEDILTSGLKAMSRQYVHLSENIDTANEVGKRYGAPVILKVNSFSMYQSGMKFAQADNGVWLVEEVPISFLELFTS